MGAFNWIALSAVCPHCGNACDIIAQTHIASLYDGNSETRFHDKTYIPGDTMLWYNNTDPKYNTWRQGNCKTALPSRFDSECCYARCKVCQSECFAIIHFNDRVITAVETVGILSEWPEEYNL